MSTVTTHIAAPRTTLDSRRPAGLPIGLLALLLVCAGLVVASVVLSAPILAIAAGLTACAATTTHAFCLLDR